MTMQCFSDADMTSSADTIIRLCTIIFIKLPNHFFILVKYHRVNDVTIWCLCHWKNTQLQDRWHIASNLVISTMVENINNILKFYAVGTGHISTSKTHHNYIFLPLIRSRVPIGFYERYYQGFYFFSNVISFPVFIINEVIENLL